jgi:hypothetical protein
MMRDKKRRRKRKNIDLGVDEYAIVSKAKPKQCSETFVGWRANVIATYGR